jgi:hypothetical protein
VKELTYFDRHIRGEGTDDPRILYELKPEYMIPIERDIERYWHAYIGPSPRTGSVRVFVNRSSDKPTLPVEALQEFSELYHDWLEMNKAYANG